MQQEDEVSSAGRDALVAMLSRLKNDLKRADLGKPDQASQALLAKYPLTGDYIAEVRRLCERGLEDGWLCPGEETSARSARLAGTSTWFPFSIEASLLKGEAEPHAAPKGEVGLCWPVTGKPKYCGSGPGWVVFAPGSRTVPRVTGGTMFMLSFLPEGAIERGVKVNGRRRATSRGKASTATRTAAKRKAAPKRSPGRRAAGGARNS
jgi:hypothetical protein